MIAQQVVTHEVIYKMTNLLDQFCEEKLRILQLIHAFPQLYAPLSTLLGDISTEDVSEAAFIKDETELHPEDRVLLGFLQTFIQICDQGGKFQSLLLVGRMRIMASVSTTGLCVR